MAARLMYREDDDSFKGRLNTAIQLAWVYNTSITIIVMVAIFWLLELNMVMGIVLGILLAMLSNLHLTLSRVAHAERWEIYKNRVVVPKGFSGGSRTIPFSDLRGISRRRGLTGEVMVLELTSGESITLDLEEQEKPLAALELAFRQFARSQDGAQKGISIPVSQGLELEA